MNSGSGICESDGWGELSVCVTRSASDSSQGERGRKKTKEENMGLRLYITSIHIFLSADILVRICEGSCGEAEESSWGFFVLREEFLLKTESEYLRDAKDTLFTLANP